MDSQPLAVGGPEVNIAWMLRGRGPAKAWSEDLSSHRSFTRYEYSANLQSAKPAGLPLDSLVSTTEHSSGGAHLSDDPR